MILDDYIKVKIGGRNIKHFRKKYDNIRMYDEITIPVKDLTKNSNIKINCKCGYCGIIRNISYQKYNDSNNLYGKYSCQSCSHSKRKLTNNKKYGVDNYITTDSFKIKSKITIKEKYGNDIINVFQSHIIKEKIKNTIKEKYDTEHISQSSYFKEKVEKTCLDRYGTIFYYQSKDFKIKSDNTKMILYNNVNYSNVDKQIETRIKNGNMIPKNKLSDWNAYKRIVRKLTNRKRKIVFQKWNGYDYYDGEYIVENLKMNYHDLNYPTIDHMISIKYGFDNNIIPNVITDLGNMVITKRIINSKKGANNSL